MFASAKKMSDELAALKKEMEAKGQAILRESFTEFFDAHPAVTGVRWTQYTPYFNDGDPCNFRTGDPYVRFEKKPDGDLSTFAEHYGDEDNEDAAQFVSTWSMRDSGGPYDAAKKSIRELFGLVPDEMFQAAFGDHVEVTAKRDGFDIEEHEHE